MEQHIGLDFHTGFDLIGRGYHHIVGIIAIGVGVIISPDSIHIVVQLFLRAAGCTVKQQMLQHVTHPAAGKTFIGRTHLYHHVHPYHRQCRIFDK